MAQNVGASAVSPDELKTFPVFPVSIIATHGFCKKGHFDLIQVGLLWKKSRDSQLILSCGVTQNWRYRPLSDELLKSRSLTALIFTQQFLSSKLAGEVRISSAFMGGIFRRYLPTRAKWRWDMKMLNWPQLFTRWITLSIGEISIRWIAQLVFLILMKKVDSDLSGG